MLKPESITFNVNLTTPEAVFAFLQALGAPNAVPESAPFVRVDALAPSAAPANAPLPGTTPIAPIAAVPVATTPAAPAAPVSATPVPTSAPEYTFDTLARAAAPLTDAGKTDELRALLRSFNVQALTQLPKEQYGAFATGLRGLGARI